MQINMTESIRIFDVIREDNIRGSVSSEFKNLPLYELVEQGTLKENYGIRKNPDDILYYDVTNASEELRTQHQDLIEELEVKKIISIIPKTSLTPGNIITLLPFGKIYGNLSKEELRMIGHDFISLSSSPEGIRILPVINAKVLPDNMYVKIDTTRLSEDLYNKLSNEMIELSKKENGFYEDKGAIQTKKELK